MEVDLSRLNTNRAILGAAASALLIVSLLFFPWFDLTENPQRLAGDPGTFICGTNEYKCTGFETFPILRWLLLAGAAAPLILAWILIRGHRLSWAPGELTMVVGFTAFVLVAYNGIIDRPGSGIGEAGVGLSYGYWLALLATAAMAATGFLRSLESGGRAERKPPGNV